MLAKQRNVSDTLGKNVTSNHEKIYDHIESKIGKTKKCTFGHVRGSKTGVKHEGEENVPIRDFELKRCSINEMNEVVTACGDGLQGFCRECSKNRRIKRLEMSRDKNKGGYVTYEESYGKDTKMCSVCKHEKKVRDHFKLSPGMECGLHNVCNSCSKTYGESMGCRLIKYRPDGNFRYTKTTPNQHDDHIMPLVYGGTNEEINHQLLSSRENLAKSSSVMFDNVMHINPLLLSSRWRYILYEAQREKNSVTTFKSRMAVAILEENRRMFRMSDIDIEQIYRNYNIDNNRRLNTDRCVQKFKAYCTEILKMPLI